MLPDRPTAEQYFPAEERHRQQQSQLHAIIWHSSDGLLAHRSQEAGCRSRYQLKQSSITQMD